MNIGISFTNWRGIRLPKFIGLDNYDRLMGDGAFWCSLEHTLFFVVAMAVVPTIISLIVASVLFDYISARFGQSHVELFPRRLLPAANPADFGGRRVVGLDSQSRTACST